MEFVYVFGKKIIFYLTFVVILSTFAQFALWTTCLFSYGFLFLWIWRSQFVVNHNEILILF